MQPHFRLTALTLAIAGAFSFSSMAHAQAQQATEEGNENTVTKDKDAHKKNDATDHRPVQQVTISAGRTEMEERRQSTAAKMIFGREELDKNGDSTIGEILKRLPGVTIGGRPGRGGDIRMRGMGNGYTQILLNGERAPRGFSMDSLSPDQVERIEIIRGPVAEYSTQAIAGTINIVLRDEYKQKDTDIKISEAFEQGRSAPNISITKPGELGRLSYSLSASLFRRQLHDQSDTYSLEKDANDQASLIQDQLDQTNRRTTGIHFTPRLNYHFENGDTLTVQPFIMNARSTFNTESRINQTLGLPSPYAIASTTGDANTTFARAFGNWQHKLNGNGKLAVKFSGGVGKMDNSSLRYQYASDGAQVDRISDVSNTRDSSVNTSGKYTQPFGEGHTLAAGWELESGKRSETRTSLDNGAPQFAESGDNLDAKTRRVAVFIQDEFDINPQFSAYAGLRWEGIRTSSTTANNVVDSTSSVWSPVLHGVWRIPGKEKDQVRLSLTSSYRAPTLNDLIALPSISNQNGPTRPDRTGNPLLKPELSKGLDLAYEHYLTRSGIISANLFVRNIDDLIRRRTLLMQTSSGLRWVSSPVNIGHAVTRGIELEAKFQLQEFFPNAAAIDVRSNYSRFWSSVDDIPGPNNTLDQQPQQTANFGLDYRAAHLPLTVGGNINWTPAYVTQSSATQVNTTGMKRQLDLYGLWKFKPDLQVRLSANNVQASDYLSGTAVTTGGVNRIDYTSSKTFTTWTIRLEMKI